MCGMVYYRNIIATKSSKHIIASHSRHTLVLHLPKGKDSFLPGGFPGSSVGKESTSRAGDPDSIPGSGRSAGEGIGYPLQYSWISLVGSAGKESACNGGDPGSIPGLGRSPGEGKGYPLQYPGLGHRVRHD